MRWRVKPRAALKESEGKIDGWADHANGFISGTKFHCRRTRLVGFSLEVQVTEDDIPSTDAKAA